MENWENNIDFANYILSKEKMTPSERKFDSPIKLCQALKIAKECSRIYQESESAKQAKKDIKDFLEDKIDIKYLQKQRKDFTYSQSVRIKQVVFAALDSNWWNPMSRIRRNFKRIAENRSIKQIIEEKVKCQ